MPLYLCNLRFWACKWDPLPLRDSSVIVPYLKSSSNLLVTGASEMEWKLTVEQNIENVVFPLSDTSVEKETEIISIIDSFKLNFEESMDF